MQEEVVPSLPASEAGRPDGSNSAPSDNAQWGLAATGSGRQRHMKGINLSDSYIKVFQPLMEILMSG